MTYPWLIVFLGFLSNRGLLKRKKLMLDEAAKIVADFEESQYAPPIRKPSPPTLTATNVTICRPNQSGCADVNRATQN